MAYIPPAGDAANFSLASYTPSAGDAANFELSVPVLLPFFLGFMPHGKLGEVGEPDPLGVKGIYHRRMTRRGKVSIKMKFYVPTNPQTEPQEANRSKFAAAMSTWMALTEGQKDAYVKRAKRRGMRASGLYIREYYQSNP